VLPSAPSLPVAGPTSAAWREEALTKVQELSGLVSWIIANNPESAHAGDLVKSITNHLQAAQDTAAGTVVDGDRKPGPWKRWKSSFGGSSFERALGNLDAVEVSVLRLAPEDYLRGQMPSLQAHVNRFLPKDDPRRVGVDGVAEKPDGYILTAADRDMVIAAYHAANTQRRRDLLRVSSFRNWVAAGTGVLTVVAIVIAVIGLTHKTWIPMCFFPEEQQTFVCPIRETPTGDPATADIDTLVVETAEPEDLLLIELVGLIAAALAAAVALRGMRGTSTPDGVPVGLALFKLPTGALTAVLGILLMRGGFVPGLSALDSSAQILAWAVIFGYAQQLLTRLIDSQAHGLLADVGGRGAAGDRQKTKR
jgi:hypothetical protein